MTEQQTLPPAYQPGTDPKAAAKAAKAYAKATRPWYKKKRWIGAIALLVIIGFSAANGGGSDTQAASDDSAPMAATQKESAAKDAKPAANKPAAAKPDNTSKGKGAITWGNWQVEGRVQVKDSGINTYDVVTRVKNTSDAVDQGMFTVTILKGATILGTATCSTSDVNPGAVATANCFSDDDFVPGWTEISIENAF